MLLLGLRDTSTSAKSMTNRFAVAHKARTLMLTGGGWCEHFNQPMRLMACYSRRAQVLTSARTSPQVQWLAGGIHHLRACPRYCRSMPPKRNTERRVATAVRLPESLHHQLQDQADLRDVSVNFLVVRAVTRYLQSAPDPLALEEPVAMSA